MTIKNSRVSRVAFTCVMSTAACLVATAPAAFAQAAVDNLDGAEIQVQLPMNDADCSFNGSITAVTVPPCSVDGVRKVGLRTVARTSYSSGLDIVTGHYAVAFDGTLHIDGLPISTLVGTPNSFPLDYPGLFGGGMAEVDLFATYEGDTSRLVAKGAATPNMNFDPAYFSNASNFTTEVRSIKVQLGGDLETTNGGEYEYQIAALDPTAILNGNSVALSGRFNGDNGNGRLEFGKLTGTATLLTGNVVTPYPKDVFGAQNAYYSNFGLSYDVTAQVTTTIDADGITTPTIAVTDGIQMNGSKVTGLAAGTAPGDAVNKAQLDTEAKARMAADFAITHDLAVEAATRAHQDTVLNQRIANEITARQELAAYVQSESNARAAADLALSTRINAVGTRLDALTNRVGALEQRVDRLDRKIASSTAIAVAMSGNTFLPDMKFNLTANVATYDGAQAGSFQMGAMVSDHVAVNAGVATNFSKGNKAAGRVGFTVGW